MKDSKLTLILSLLQASDWQELARMAESPFFNRRPEVIALLQYCRETLLDAGRAPDKQEAFQRVFGKRPYDDHRIRMSISFLYALIEQYLLWRRLQADRRRHLLLLGNELRRLRSEKIFRSAMLEAEKTFAAYPYRNADYLEQYYQLRLEQYQFEVDQGQLTGLNLQTLSNQLDTAYLARKLWQCCFMRTHEAVANVQYDYGLLQPVLEAIAQRPELLRTPAVGLYHACYMALRDPEETGHFAAFRRLLHTHDALFPPEELRDLYLLAVNFCIRQYNEGKTAYLNEQFDLYKKGLEMRYFIKDGSLSRYTYLNVATIGLVLHEYAWVADFIEQYRSLLPAEHRDSLYSFNQARLAHQQGHFGRALQLLQKTDYKDLPLSLAAKTLQIKIYYALGETDLLDAHLEAIRTFIRRKKILGYIRENYLNTLRFVQKILELPPGDKAARLALQQEIGATGAVAEKEWLLGVLGR